MVLKKIGSMSFQVEKFKCVRCGLLKEMPVMREVKKCDDCHDLEIQEEERIERIKAQEAYLRHSNIPERYWGFDTTKLEVDSKTFQQLILTPDAILISGEIGTGKTNLACQVLMRSRGKFYTVNSIYQLDATHFDWAKHEALICVDDISKVAFAKVADRLFDLINYRYSHNKKTIFTTDKKLEELQIVLGTEYGSAIASRLREWCTSKIKLEKKWR